MTKFSTLLAAALVAASSTVAFASAGENGNNLYINNIASMVEGRNSAETASPAGENGSGIHAFIATAGRAATEGRNSASAQLPVGENDVRR